MPAMLYGITLAMYQTLHSRNDNTFVKVSHRSESCNSNFYKNFWTCEKIALSSTGRVINVAMLILNWCNIANDIKGICAKTIGKNYFTKKAVWKRLTQTYLTKLIYCQIIKVNTTTRRLKRKLITSKQVQTISKTNIHW